MNINITSFINEICVERPNHKRLQSIDLYKNKKKLVYNIIYTFTYAKPVRKKSTIII